MADATRCCGFGGLFMAKLPEISIAIADDKAESIIATGADTVTGCDSALLPVDSRAVPGAADCHTENNPGTAGPVQGP